MSLFQICYGPEISAIFQTIQENPGLSKEEIITKYQYQPQGDITSLVDAVINFLFHLGFIRIDHFKNYHPTHNVNVKDIDYLRRLQEIAHEPQEPAHPNVIFSTMYNQLFVVPNQLYIENLYYEANLQFDRLAISQEKVNAWKRIMEFFGLGYRIYGGFYALPHPTLMENIIKEIGTWEGPLQLFFEKKISHYIPCFHNGTVYNGVLFAVINLGQENRIELSLKQDLPYHSYGGNSQWNWVKIGGEVA